MSLTKEDQSVIGEIVGAVVGGVLAKLQEAKPVEQPAQILERMRAPARENPPVRSTRRARVPVPTPQGIYDVDCELGFQAYPAFEERPARTLFVELLSANFDSWIRDRGGEFDQRNASDRALRERDPSYEQDYQRRRERYIMVGAKGNLGLHFAIRVPLVNMLAGKTEEYMASRGWLLPTAA
jgi:hypothetical protein